MFRCVTACCTCYSMLSCSVLKKNKVVLLLILEKRMHRSLNVMIAIVMAIGFLLTMLVYVYLWLVKVENYGVVVFQSLCCFLKYHASISITMLVYPHTYFGWAKSEVKCFGSSPFSYQHFVVFYQP
jgi:hypothetical protein